jgi:hypothetical protein
MQRKETAMNTSEKIAATYLRLNGFFVLPLFTVFDGEHHNHLDLLSVHTPGSTESVHGIPLLTDPNLFAGLEKLGAKPNEQITGVASEVKTGKEKGEITQGHINYAARFVNAPLFPVWFYRVSAKPPWVEEDQLRISLPYAIDWIISRFDWMELEAHKFTLTKTGSWTWSEQFLADLLVLRSFGVLRRLPE